MKSEFDRAMRALCEAESIAPAEPLMQGASIALDEVLFSFMYDEEVAADSLYLRVVFGEAPLHDETAIFKALLQQNHAAYRGRGAGFCIARSSGEVLYLHEISLAQATPALLTTTMRYFTGKVKAWQKSFYLPCAVQPSARAVRRLVA